MSPRIVPLAEAAGIGAGGKAEGLARLIALGLDVPGGFVVVGASPGELPSGLDDAYDALGRGAVAVRSSAADEDGEGASFAGQHDTILGVRGIDALRDAIERCLASLHSTHATAYRAARTDESAARMSVVVQRMVDARAAGVVFSADPVSARRDRVVVDLVSGLGDALVSGHVTPDHFLLDRDGVEREVVLAGETRCVDAATVRAIALRAVSLEASFGHPVDGELAIDRDGSVKWLQARPITTLPADPRELDSRLESPRVLTKCNIGEMMPGAATPLTWSLSARGIDHGMQRMYTEIGVLEGIRPEPLFVRQFFGHLFLDLTSLGRIAGAVASASEEDVASSICGRPVPEIPFAPRASKLTRARNGLAYAARVFSYARQVRALDDVLARTAIRLTGDARAIHASIDAHVPELFASYYHHLVASTLAGAVASAVLKTLAKDGPITEAHHARVAELLAGAEGVESHDIALGIDRIVAAVLEHDPRAGAGLAELDAASALEFLRREASAPIRQVFAAYLARHGHRCVREVEFREREWSVDPTPIVQAIVAGVRAARGGRRPKAPSPPVHIPGVLGVVARVGREGVRAREAAKSKLVLVTSRFKAAYRALGARLVEESLLPDADLVYFLTHEEVGTLVRMRRAELAVLARTRRDVLPIQMKLVFPEVFVGAPEPLVPEPPSGEQVVHGKPVSRGVVRGRARVALTLADAHAVEPGEILIAPITDVGWTPCFATIAGLATDIGSAVSHGAVVAREYGLPAIVNTRVGTSTFRTGDLVELDADLGVLRLVD